MKVNESGTGAMTAAKNKVFIRLSHENCYLVGGNESSVCGGKNLVGGVFWRYFWWGRDE